MLKHDNMTTNHENPKHLVDGPNREQFMEFLESNLNSIISCPIAGTTFFNPVTCSDGFSYEASVIEEYQVQYPNSKSPITREPLSKTLHKNNLILQLINYSDKYDLEVSKNKFINGDSFEENVEIIQSSIANGKYEDVYKFKNFILGFGQGQIDSLFCKKILNCAIHNSREYVNCIKYILDHSNDIEFVTTSSNNILHVFFRFCKEIELIDYLLTKMISSAIITNMLDVIDDQGFSPIDMALNNESPVFKYIIENNIITNASAIIVNSCILREVNNEMIIKLISQVNDINVFVGENNMSPMFCAIRMGNIDIVDCLISKNYNMEMKSPSNLNAFHYAAKHGNSKILNYMLDMCSNLEEDSAGGWKIIHICSYYNTFDSIMYLLEKFVNLTIPITTFEGHNKEYLPINLVEINRNLKDDERQTLINEMIQLMELQLY